MITIADLDKKVLRKNIPQVRTGDRVRVSQKVREGAKERIQVFEGVVIKTAGGCGINGSFTVRRLASGVGVEKTFPLHLPTLVKVEKLKSAKVRQSRIFYVRKLAGKAAHRMKNEKDAAAVWEDVVEDKKAEPVEIPQAELDAMKAAEKAEEKGEVSDEPSSSTEDTLDKPQDQEKSKTEEKTL